MILTPKTFNITLFNDADSEILADEYQNAILAQGGTQKAKKLNVDAFIAFIIPGALEADYNAADQTKKEVMANICQQTIASGEDFDTFYTAEYNKLYP